MTESELSLKEYAYIFCLIKEQTKKTITKICDI